MNKQDVTEVLSSICRIPTNKIHGHLSLGSLGLNSSFGLSALRSRLEKETKNKIANFSVNTKVDELLNIINNKNVPQKKIVHTLAEAPSSSANRDDFIGLGIDMQEINTMPITQNYRENDFYKSHFSKEEISTAMLKQNARQHFCGIFCAKEAVKKTDAQFLNLRMDYISIMHNKDGRPIVKLNKKFNYDENFHFILTITHTESFAAACCALLYKKKLFNLEGPQNIKVVTKKIIKK